MDPYSGRAAVVNEVMFRPATMAMLHELIPALVKKRVRGYRGVSGDDLEAVCWLAAVEQAGTVDTLAAEGSAAAVEALLTRAVTAAQSAEEREQRARRAAAHGYHPQDEQFYSLPLLRALLPAWLDGGVSEHPPQSREDSAGARPPASSGGYGEWPVMMLDIDAGMKAIKPYHRERLVKYFRFPQGSSGWTHAEISSAMGLQPETLRKQIYRALKALQDELGGGGPH